MSLYLDTIHYYKPTKAILKFRMAFLLLVMDLYLLRLWSVCSLRIGVVFLVNICVVALACGQTASLSGHVKNGESGESLSGAVVRVNGLESSTSTNSYGFYSLSLPNGTHVVEVTYVGFQPRLDTLRVNGNLKRDFELTSVANAIEEVVVSARSESDNVTSPQMGNLNFTMEELKNVPVIFGEQDVLKAIQLMPGVATGGEGSSSFYVRGGSGDQNLILLDEATVYNASHLMGFFSTFNSDAVKEATLYKGGVPAQYGGRISSVLDISMLEGNNKHFAAEGGVGLIASRLKLEGPLVRDRGSFMISGRRTYADLFLKLSNDETVKNSQLYFYDLNAKMNFKVNEKNRVYLSGYFGKDDLGYSDLFGFDWGNATATVRWNSILNPKLFSNTTMIYSDFSYNVDVNSDNADFSISSKIRNWNLKQDFSLYAANNHTLRFGLNVLHQRVMPASLAAAQESEVNSINIEDRNGLEAAAYLSHEWKAGDRLSLIYGVRLTDFMVMGPGTFYDFDREGAPISEQRFNSRIIKHYLNLEPRLSLALLLDERQSVKASFNRMTQHLHQLTNTTASLPTDQYVLSSLNIRPQIADQVAVGYFRNFQQNQYEFSAETYFKKMHHQIDFRNGADLQANKYMEGDLLYGQGRAYGVELLLRKNKGRLTGWLGYTLARSERQFDDINQGTWFAARQDRTHDLSAVGIYQLNKRWAVGATFVFNTGHAITFPSGKYEVEGTTMFYYTERNGYRMPNYHRLDLSATYEPQRRADRTFHSSWSFGLYNVYNRKNAYIIDFREQKQNPNITEAYKIALFGIVPSVTWNFKF